MAETLISPGVLALENDQSFVSQQPVTVGAAIIGPTVKGPVQIPTVVTTYSDYLNKFGSSFLSGGNLYSYFTSIAAYNYFQNGGETLLVTRVVSGSFTSATASIFGSGTLEAFTLKTISEGEVMNNWSNLGYIPTGSSNTLLSGSSENVRWEVSNRDTGSGTFSLLIRQGNDTETNKTVLETWTGLSLDPTQPNYIAAVIGDSYQAFSTTDGAHIETFGQFPNRSRYVYVSSVNSTPNYFDNAGSPKSQYTASIPVNGSGSSGGAFQGATGVLFTGSAAGYYDNASGSNIQGLNASNYSASITLLSNQDDYRFNVLTAPGLTLDNDVASGTTTAAGQLATLINVAQTRGDAIAVVDPVEYGSTVQNAIDEAAVINSSYGATYWPWLQTIDPGTGQLVWVPASVMIPAVYAFNDSVSEPWFAPAGINRGGLSTVVRAERKLTQTQRDNLYTIKCRRFSL